MVEREREIKRHRIFRRLWALLAFLLMLVYTLVQRMEFPLAGVVVGVALFGMLEVGRHTGRIEALEIQRDTDLLRRRDEDLGGAGV